MEKPIYLTTSRLLYNMARVDHRYGRVTDSYLQMRKEKWEREYSLDNYEELFGPKKY